jgi:hypothetical protein
MDKLRATEVIVGEADQDQSWIEFRWPDPLTGWDCLRIEPDGFCSRRMPVRSGSGLRDLELSRDAARLWLSADLAAKLGLPEAVEIGFAIPDEAFAELGQAVDSIGWPAPPGECAAEPDVAPDRRPASPPRDA